MFGRYLSWNSHGQKKKKKNTTKKKKAYGKGDDLDDLFTVSLCVLADVENYFFAHATENIPTFLLSFFLF